jgi:hypothetical protein
VGERFEGDLSLNLFNLRAILCSSNCCICFNNHLVFFTLLGSALNSCMI